MEALREPMPLQGPLRREREVATKGSPWTIIGGATWRCPAQERTGQLWYIKTCKNQMIWIDNVVGKPENLEDRCLRSYLELIHGF